MQIQAKPLSDVIELEGIVRKVEPRGPSLVGAARPEPAFTVESASGELRARRAVGCLVAPIEGDRVLVARTADGRAYVLSVLEREAEAQLSLETDRSLTLKSAAGRVELLARDGLEIVTSADVAITGKKLEVCAPEAVFGLGRLTVTADEALGEVSTMKLVSETVESVIGTLSQRLKRARRVVEEIDQLRAKYVDVIAKKALRMHAESAVVTADQLVKVDGDQIHIG